MNASAECLFDRGGWWDPACREFASLRSVSAFRLQLLRQWLGHDWAGRVVVDLGCGGGLLAVPLARSGARVVGVDVAPVALQSASAEASKPESPNNCFLAVMGRMQASPMCDESADVVLLADVLEHVEDPSAAVLEAARLLRPGGYLFVNTINRSWRSRLLAIWLAEGMGFVPKGTHQWHMFVKPVELEDMTCQAGLRQTQATGESPKLLQTVQKRAVILRKSRSMAIGYAALFVKERL